MGSWQRELSSNRWVGGPVIDLDVVLKERLDKMGGVVSVLAVPVFVGELWYGFMAVDDCFDLRDWRSEIGLFLDAASMLGNHLRNEIMAQALRDSEELMHNIFRSIPSGVGLISNGRLNWCNDQLAGMVEYPVGELAGRDLRDFFINEQDALRVHDLLSGQVERGGTGTVEARWQRRSGQIFDVLLSVMVLQRMEVPSMMVCTVQDISWVKQTERRLHEAYEIINSSPAVAYMMSAGAQVSFEYFSDNVEELVGYTVEDLISGRLSYRQIIHPDDLEWVEHGIRGGLHQEAPRSYKPFRIICRSGEVKWLDNRLTACRDKSGAVTHYKGLLLNVTAQKSAEDALQQAYVDLEQRVIERTAALAEMNRDLKDEIAERRSAERALRRSEDQYRKIFESSLSGIVISDLDGIIQEVNPAILKMFGYTTAELYLKDYRDFVVAEDVFVIGEFKRNLEILAAGHELECRAKDGRICSVALNGWLISNTEGRPERIGVFVRDVTEHKRLEREAHLLNAELIHMGRVTSMGELAASLAHEINQPLTAILSNTQAAQRFLQCAEPDLDEVAEILADIAKDDMRAGEVIKRLRALLRKDMSVYAQLDISESVAEVLSLVGGEARMKGVRIDTRLQPGLPSVSGDRVQLQQVIINLISNALDACADMPDGLRRVVVSTYQTSANRVGIGIEDFGPGLKDIEMIFEPFYTTKAKGMGMGLSISQTIIDAHGGELRGENKSGGGSVFYVNLPASGLVE